VLSIPISESKGGRSRTEHLHRGVPRATLAKAANVQTPALGGSREGCGHLRCWLSPVMGLVDGLEAWTVANQTLVSVSSKSALLVAPGRDARTLQGAAPRRQGKTKMPFVYPVCFWGTGGLSTRQDRRGCEPPRLTYGAAVHRFVVKHP